jgi:predicted enzyme related to lactoylglutathione lyase
MAKIPTGRFVWFEYSSQDASKAQAFFGELFGWKTRTQAAPAGAPPEQSYTMIALGDQTIGGYWPAPPPGAPQHAQWISHLQVEDATASAARVKELGGEVVMPPMVVGDSGTFAVVKDPTGAVFSLWQPEKHLGQADYLGKDGSFCWDELTTDDPDRALAFYKGLGGFTVESMDMGDMTYHVLNSDGAGRAGVMKAPMAGVPNAWTPYVKVDDVDRVAERARKMNAVLRVPPTDIPGIGRFSIIEDPQGGVLGILKPAPRS